MSIHALIRSKKLLVALSLFLRDQKRTIIISKHFSISYQNYKFKT